MIANAAQHRDTVPHHLLDPIACTCAAPHARVHANDERMKGCKGTPALFARLPLNRDACVISSIARTQASCMCRITACRAFSTDHDSLKEKNHNTVFACKKTQPRVELRTANGAVAHLHCQ